MTIKRLRGQADAVASAYSLSDYLIAEDLGGQAAYENLRDRARGAGDSAGERYGAEPYGHRLEVDDGTPGVVFVAGR